MRLERLRAVERLLLPLTVATTALGLAAPALGQALKPGITPLLALLMFLISLTFDAAAVREVLRRPGYQVVATLLVYGPMSLAGAGIGRLLFGEGPLAIGQALVGALPTDVSSPLLVLLGRGNVALAAVLNAVNHALAPMVVPALLLLLTGVHFAVPVGALVIELFLIIVVPMSAAIALRTRFPAKVARFDPVYTSASSIAYLLLLLAVVGPNAATILGYGWYAALIALGQLILNLIGYGLGLLARGLIREREDRIAFLFTVSKKEFSIAAAVVVTTGLPDEVLIPAVFYAVLQMITSPTAVMILNRLDRQDAGGPKGCRR